jgi:hypothetical protein
VTQTRAYIVILSDRAHPHVPLRPSPPRHSRQGSARLCGIGLWAGGGAAQQHRLQPAWPDLAVRDRHAGSTALEAVAHFRTYLRELLDETPIGLRLVRRGQRPYDLMVSGPVPVNRM